jgi:pyridoxal phosphate enzyme (YggS family)
MSAVSVTQLVANLKTVRERIAQASLRAGRSPADVKLLAVSKTHSIELIRAAFHEGQLAFGENYVQEALPKLEALPDAEWHLIGPLQSKKAKQVAGRFKLIHTLDREKLAAEVSKAVVERGLIQDVLIQVRIGDEETKSGVSASEAAPLLERIQELHGLRLRGLMALPPLSEDETVARGYFSELRELAEKLRQTYLSPQNRSYFTELSMGTSSDFEWAILEGATIVRVGTSIFGGRV